jgi:hypothetical protein
VAKVLQAEERDKMWNIVARWKCRRVLWGFRGAARS